jgi:hypothetical protein
VSAAPFYLSFLIPTSPPRLLYFFVSPVETAYRGKLCSLLELVECFLIFFDSGPYDSHEGTAKP